jgi:hypothetical protein
MVIVTANHKFSSGRIYEFVSKKSLREYWSVPSLCGGVDIDRERKLVYFGDVQHGRLMVFDVNNPSAGEQFVLDLPKSSVPSAMAFDASSQRIFIGDGANGVIYSVHVPSKSLSVLGQIKGAAVTAVVFDSKRQILFFTDGNSGRIYSLSFQKNATPRVFYIDRKLRHLSGLSLRSTGDFIVADTDSPNLLVISAVGKFTGAISTTETSEKKAD